MSNRCVKCNNCGHVGYSTSKGNVFILIALAFLGFIPAVIYYFWSISGLGRCSNCHSTALVPSNSCPPQDKLDPFRFIAMWVLAIGVTFFILLAYGLGSTVWQRITMTDEQKQAMAQHENFEKCVKHGQEYLKAYPEKLPAEIRTKHESLIPYERLTYVEKVCRQSKTETFPQ